VKQVHMVKMKNSDSDNDEEEERKREREIEKTQIVAIIRKGTEADALETLGALRKVKSIEYMMSRIQRLVFKELNLLSEKESFEKMPDTDFGKQPQLIHLKISDYISLGCLFRDLAQGDTVAKILESKETEEK